jgi:hypothetical protein
MHEATPQSTTVTDSDDARLESRGYRAVRLLPTGLSSPRAHFNLDWITLVVMFIVAIAGVIFFLIAHSGKELSEHLRDDAEKPAALGEH